MHNWHLVGRYASGKAVLLGIHATQKIARMFQNHLERHQGRHSTWRLAVERSGTTFTFLES